MNTTTYRVSTIARTDDDAIVTGHVGEFASKTKAMAAAKRAARTRKDCIVYGPSSLAYVGAALTAVVSW